MSKRCTVHIDGCNAQSSRRSSDEGRVVNGPGECEGADVAIFGGKRRGIICVQGEQKQTVSEDQMLDALLHECRQFAAKVERGEAQLKNAPAGRTSATSIA